MKKSLSKVMTSVLAVSILASSAVTAFAIDPPTVDGTVSIDAAGGSQTVPVKLEAEAVQFSVTVPSSLPVALDAKGKVQVASDAKIVNNGYAPVKVKNITIAAQGTWESVDYDTFEPADEALNTNKFALMMNEQIKTTGANKLNFEDTMLKAIPATDPEGTTDELAITYSAKVPGRTTAISEPEIMANVVFTIGWADDASAASLDSGEE